MNVDLEHRAIEILKEEYGKAPGKLNSKAVYDRLVVEEWTVPDRHLGDLWGVMQGDGTLEGKQVLGGTRVEVAGDGLVGELLQSVS